MQTYGRWRRESSRVCASVCHFGRLRLLPQVLALGASTAAHAETPFERSANLVNAAMACDGSAQTFATGLRLGPKISA